MKILPTYKDGVDRDKQNPFRRTGRPFGGMVADIVRRSAFYKSDFTDAFNFQCFSTIVFMYFASIGFVITFAGLMGKAPQLVCKLNHLNNDKNFKNCTRFKRRCLIAY